MNRMKNPPRIAIFLNPSSGNFAAGKKKETLETLLKQKGINYQLFVSQSASHFQSLVLDKVDQFDALVAAGGDSTLLMLITSLRRNQIQKPVGMVGIGSSNDIMRHYRLETMEAAVRALQRYQICQTDMIRIQGGTEEFLAMGQVNTGLGVYVNLEVERLKNSLIYSIFGQTGSGLFAIIKGYLYAHSRSIAQKLEIFRNREVWGQPSEEYDIALFSKISFWASGKLFAPEANAQDGKIHAILVRRRSLLSMIRLILASAHGNHLAHKGVFSVQEPSFSMKKEAGFPLQVDGEVIKDAEGGVRLFQEVKIEVLLGVLPLIC